MALIPFFALLSWFILLLCQREESFPDALVLHLSVIDHPHFFNVSFCYESLISYTLLVQKSHQLQMDFTHSEIQFHGHSVLESVRKMTSEAGIRVNWAGQRNRQLENR